ncbi:hypothetical protein ACJMK2_015767 [Sinanodonta woodiana]|uniref:Chitin-binding type-2 domain-containing protein n=1 Tax=Sinanodonta woodiana TaxID=1069815 RepID=A0ABD3URQ5_SINWO
MNQSTRIAIICLAVCTVLLSTAYSETCSFLDTCTQLESYSTSCGWWGFGSCTAYRIRSYSCYTTSTCTYTLRSCGPCPVTCGNGTQYCTYECRSGTSCFLSDMIKIQSCNTQACPVVDGGWGLWASWTSECACSVTCGGGTNITTRKRYCDSPVPRNGGEQCKGISTDYQTFSCSAEPCPVQQDVNGNWSAWNGWTSYGTCTVTCGTGMLVQTRNRTCTNPIPQIGGRKCNGTSTESQTSECNTQACPVDGNWGAWSSWTSIATCSATCGTGVKTETRSRNCSNPAPQYGGRQCNGTSTEFQTSACNTNLCPIDGNWGAWNSWTPSATCSVSCGTGVKTETRSRNCSNPVPQNGGRQCNGTSTENQTSACNTNLCPIDGNWGAWSSWTLSATCSVSCGTGVKTVTRNRTCSNPVPQNGGRQCNGTSTENQTSACNTNLCPIDGNWGAWSSWTSNARCSVTCGTGVKTETRSRNCSNPVPQNGGRQCNGTSTENQTSACNTNLCPIDGNWGAWSSWTSNATCSLTCGTGVKTETRSRNCSNPMPQNGGRQCNGTSTENQTSACNTNLCPIDGNWGAWSSWTSNARCSVTCGTGVKTETRSRNCSNPVPQNGGRQCNGTSTENQTSACNTNLCPIDGNWGAWSSWTSNATCSLTCGTGVKTETRNRTCSNPVPQNGGRQCNGTSTENQTSACNTNLCPIDGGWSAWTSWISAGTCNATCSGCNEIQTRNRTCTNPIPQNGGRQCNGTSNESQAIPCGSSTCPVVDGGWSNWCDWITDSDCSATCGGGTKPQRRTRTCSEKWPINGGRQCIGSSAETRIVQCSPQPCPPVDGRWGSWTSWTSSTTWNVTCSNGKQTRTRTRFCNDPFPQNCGRPCNGSSVESVVIQCNKQTCPSECNTSSEATVVCGPSSSGMNMNLTTSSNGGSGCNSINCTCAEITHGYVRHPTDCTKFIICAWNVQFVDSCKNGTYWDQRRLACRRGTC